MHPITENTGHIICDFLTKTHTCLSNGPAGDDENSNTILWNPSSDDPRRNEKRYCHNKAYIYGVIDKNRLFQQINLCSQNSN